MNTNRGKTINWLFALLNVAAHGSVSGISWRVKGWKKRVKIYRVTARFQPQTHNVEPYKSTICISRIYWTYCSSSGGVEDKADVDQRVAESGLDRLQLLVEVLLHVAPLQGLLEGVRHDGAFKFRALRTGTVSLLFAQPLTVSSWSRNAPEKTCQKKSTAFYNWHWLQVA